MVILIVQKYCHQTNLLQFSFASKRDSKWNHQFFASISTALVPRRLSVAEGLEDIQAKNKNAFSFTDYCSLFLFLI